MPPDIEIISREYEALKGSTERAQCESHWEMIAEVMEPNGRGFTGARTVGDRRTNRLVDSTGVHSADLLTAGLHGTATNPATKWHRLRTQSAEANKEPDVASWLDEVTNRMFQRRYAPGTRFTTALNEVFDSAGRYGTGIMFVGQRADGRALYECRALSECVIAENAEGDTDTVYRLFSWSVGQCVSEFGDKCSDKVKELWRANKVHDTVEIVHGVRPRRSREVDKKDALNKSWESIYFERATKHLLSESGFDEFPYSVFRWQRRPGETYGRGPGSVALPDVRLLQQMAVTNLKGMQKAADPVVFLPDDAMLGPVKAAPGSFNFYRGQREIMTLPTSQVSGDVEAMMESLRNRIRTTFFADVLQIVTDAKMTATEVAQRTQERMRLLGPVIGRLEEFLGNIIDIEYAYMRRDKNIPPMPKGFAVGGALGDGDIKLTVEYVSPIANAQRMSDADGYASLMQYAAPLMQMDPTLFAKVYSPERTLSWLGERFYVPGEIRVSDEEKEAAAEAQRAQMAMAAAEPIAGAAQKGAGAIKSLADAQAGGEVDINSMIAANMDQAA